MPTVVASRRDADVDIDVENQFVNVVGGSAAGRRPGRTSRRRVERAAVAVPGFTAKGAAQLVGDSKAFGVHRFLQYAAGAGNSGP